MDDAVLVGGGQPVRELYSQIYDLLCRKRTSDQLVIESHARDVLSDQEVCTVLAAKLMHRGDVGVVQLGQCYGLFAESLAGGFVGQRARRQYLDRHISVKLLVVGTID